MRMRLLGAARSIHARLLASYFFFLLPLVAFGALWTAHLVSEARQLAVTETEEEAEYMSSRLTSLVESVEVTLKTMAEIPSVQEMNEEAEPSLASVVAINPRLNNIFIVNKDGILVRTADPSSELGAYFGDREYFKEAMSTGKVAIGEALIAGGGKAKDRPVVAVASPLSDSTGAQIGVIVADLVLRDLGEGVVEKKGDYGSYVYVADGKGNALVHPNELFVRSLKSLAEVPPVGAAIRGEQGVMEFADPFDGQSYLAVYRPVTSTRWAVVAVHPLSLLDVAKRDTAIAAALAIVFSSALALLLATLVSRPIATSISELAAAARAIGEGKLGTVVGIKRRDEIGALAWAFNTMSLDLADMVKRLEEAHRQLDKAYQEVGEALTSGLDLRLTLEVAMQSVSERLGMEAAVVGLLDQSGTCLQWAAVTGNSIKLAVGSTVDIAEADPLVQQAITSLAPVVLGEHGAAVEGSALAGAVVVLPLVSRGQCLGVFILYGEKDRPALSDEELAGAQSFANQVAVAVANATAHAEIARLVEELRLSYEQLAAQNEELQAQNEEIQVQNEEIQAQSEELQAQSEEIRAANVELQARNEELERLQAETQSHMDRLLAIGEVSAATSSSLELQEICQQAIESTVRVMESKVGTLHIANWQAETLELQAAVGAPAEYLRDYAVLPINDQSVSGRAALTGEPQISGVGSYPPITQQAMALLKTSMVVTVPIVCKGEVVGVMSVNDPHDRQPSAKEVDLLMTIANQIGVAIENGALYNQAREVDRLKDEFISIASHELKSPLTSIKGYAQLLFRRAQRAGGDEMDLRGLQVINEQIDRMTRLVNELLDVSRIEAGRLALQRQPVNLGWLLKKLVDNVQITTDKHRFNLELPQVEVAGVWDEWRVEEVLQNLLNNAVKYSPRGGSIWVKAAVVRGEVEISVRDEGIGIPKSSLPHLFERFFQASNVDRINYGGLGLGLYVSHQIILGHGGQMWVESEEGKGSTFYFTLPL